MKQRLRSAAVALLAVAGLAGAVSPASAATGGASAASSVPGAVMPVRSCSSLADTSFTAVPDARGTVTSAAVVRATVAGQQVAYCQVKGVIAPQAQFTIRLPTATWHGQYLQEGCSALCGYVPLSDYPQAGLTCTAADNGELVLAADDMGHTANEYDGSWARNSLRLRTVFGLTSEHSLAQLSKAVITAYYGRPASYAYFDGCSTGGREALMLAQRYPDDFNGIIAGAPVSNLAPLSAMFSAWLVRSNTAPGGHQILTSEKIPALHAAVIRACGNAQGVIEDPRQCAFDPASIQCPAGTNADSCLTPAQVAAVRNFYLGPTDARGRSLFNGGEPYGSELAWSGAFVEPSSDKNAPGDTPTATLTLSYLKDMAFEPNPPANFTLADVTFTDQEFAQVNQLGNAIYNANDPDLRAFEAHGGKLILYQGWADQTVSPWSSLDYYAAVERTMGGFAASQAFSRLYMIPDAYHCLYGPDHTINLANFLTPLIAWVQRGAAPRAVPADNYNRALNQITLTQTVRPYNALAPVTPAQGSLNGHYDYIGSY